MDRGKKPCTSLASSNSNIYINLKDIIGENVLRYLPAKSLHRFSCVCRDWKNYISTPFFAHRQSNSFHQVSGFFCQSPSSLLPSFISLDPTAYGVPDPSLRFLPEPVDVRCSSNGLLCCQAQGSEYKPYYICNPVTQKWKKLPKSDANHGSDPSLVLVFEPPLEKFVVEYRLICAFQSDTVGYKFDIYSSAEGSWRTSREICVGNWQIFPYSGVYVNGVVYWRPRSKIRILAFDLTSERATPLYSCSIGCLGNVNGKLCSAFRHGAQLVVFELSNIAMDMMMTIYTKEFSLEDSEMIMLTKDGGRVLFVGGETAVIYLGTTLISYNMKTKDIKELAIEADDGRSMIPYVNSLVQL
ncbi:F-box protein At5g07610 [Manihot esculenta]|uniref:Uncharacterized protein n=1 Tax=Manihot esculenta TaxID=3983 RepID=A0ACB7FYY1_MANES|nr:F-box protein At5g07610 [Manihot esculenta]KAG8633160.1 hypothetical protein MANES_18G080800v8 [Manihot esculenta]